MRSRQKMAVAARLFRARIYLISPDGLRSSFVDGPYVKQQQAADRIDFWKDRYHKHEVGWRVTGATEEAVLDWRPVY
jgi:hypothetical protein